jgi:hypothetical protein
LPSTLNTETVSTFAPIGIASQIDEEVWVVIGIGNRAAGGEEAFICPLLPIGNRPFGGHEIGSDAESGNWLAGRV